MTDLLFSLAVLAIVAWSAYSAGYSAGKYSEINRRNTRPETAEDAARMTP